MHELSIARKCRLQKLPFYAHKDMPSESSWYQTPCQVTRPHLGVCLQLCWPFNTLIQAGDNYAFDFQAEDNALDALGWNVQNETLSLFTAADFQSAFPVILVVCISIHPLRA